MKQIEVEIIVENGLVQTVYSTDQHISVNVIDLDTDEPERQKEVQENLDEVSRFVAFGTLHRVW